MVGRPSRNGDVEFDATGTPSDDQVTFGDAATEGQADAEELHALGPPARPMHCFGACADRRTKRS
jgi:hypothetical protein